MSFWKCVLYERFLLPIPTVEKNYLTRRAIVSLKNQENGGSGKEAKDQGTLGPCSSTNSRGQDRGSFWGPSQSRLGNVNKSMVPEVWRELGNQTLPQPNPTLNPF